MSQLFWRTRQLDLTLHPSQKSRRWMYYICLTSGTLRMKMEEYVRQEINRPVCLTQLGRCCQKVQSRIAMMQTASQKADEGKRGTDKKGFLSFICLVYHCCCCDTVVMGWVKKETLREAFMTRYPFPYPPLPIPGTYCDVTLSLLGSVAGSLEFFKKIIQIANVSPFHSAQHDINYFSYFIIFC